MGTSLEIVLLLSVAASATIYAFYLNVVRERAFRRLTRWLRESRPQEWGALPRSTRWLNSVGAVEQLRRGALAADPEFDSRYRHARPHQRRFLSALGIGVLAIALVAIGSQSLGWSF
jgi:hypothetical protein